MRTVTERAEAFRDLHARPGCFVLPNPWDRGSAQLLAGLGFEALATTSSGYALSRGLADGEVGRERMLEHVADLVAATDLPVSADLENGFGDAPEEVAETIRLGAEVGLAGASIEDFSGRSDAPIYALELAVERIRAAVEAARALPRPFTLTARAENFLHERPDLADTIARLQAFQEAGADVLYAPGLTSAEEIASVIAAVDRPVNVLGTMPGLELSLAELARLGVRRVSVGGALARLAYGSLGRAAGDLRSHGALGFAADSPPTSALLKLLAGRA